MTEIVGRGGFVRNSLDWLVAEFSFGLMWLLRCMPTSAAFGFADWVARRIGPLTGRHRLVLYNLKRAFPEKSDAEIKTIASDAWANMGRMLAEYVYLDDIFDLDPANPATETSGRVTITGAEHMVAAKQSGKPVIFVAMHMACFEMMPMVAAAYGFSPTVLFRPPNNPYLAARIDAFRRRGLGRLVPSHAGSSLALARTLSQGGSIGILVDQKYPPGLPTTFFGLPTQTNPLVPKLARQFDCLLVPAMCQRVEGNRYLVSVDPPMALPRLESGAVDVDATAQALNDQVEKWVRQVPGQWLWYHDRWNIKSQIGI